MLTDKIIRLRSDPHPGDCPMLSRHVTVEDENGQQITNAKSAVLSVRAGSVVTVQIELYGADVDVAANLLLSQEQVDAICAMEARRKAQQERPDETAGR